jgi:hypothetical protein
VEEYLWRWNTTTTTARKTGSVNESLPWRAAYAHTYAAEQALRWY